MRLLIFLLLTSFVFIGCVKDQSTLIDRAKTMDEINEEAKNKKRVNSYIDLAMNALRNKNYPIAYENLFKAQKLNSEDKEVLNLLGLTYLYDGKEDLAIKVLKKAIKIDPKYSEAHNHLGIVYSEIENYKEAIKHFKKALENLTYRTPWIAYTNLGKAYQMNNQHNMAIKALNRSISRNSRQCIPYNLLGQLYVQKKDYEQAEISYEGALKYCGDKGLAHFNLGVAYLQSKQFKESRKEFSACIEQAELKAEKRLLERCKRYMNLLEE